MTFSLVHYTRVCVYTIFFTILSLAYSLMCVDGWHDIVSEDNRRIEMAAAEIGAVHFIPSDEGHFHRQSK